MLQVAKVAVQ